MKRVRWLVIVASCLIGACGSVTEPSRPGVEFMITGQNQTPDASPTVPLTANASSAQRTLVIMGRIRTATPCWDLKQEVTRLANAINVTIVAGERAGVCSQVLLTRDYTLRINALAPGIYVLHVAHEYVAQDGRTWREAVLEKDIRVE